MNSSDLVSYFFYFGVGFIGILLIVYVVYFWQYKKPFYDYSINVQIRSIAGIALLSAVTTVVVIIFSQFSSIMAIPAVRSAFEGVLVKVSGFLFGPFVGIISAIVSELTVLIFIPTYFHWKFLFILMSFGAVAGLVRNFFTRKIRHNSLLLVIGLGLLLFLLLTLFFFYLSAGDSKLIKFSTWNEFKLYFQQQYLTQLNIRSISAITNLVIFLLFFLILIWFFYYLNVRGKGLLFRKKRISELLPILVLTVFSEYLVSVFIGTSANTDVFGDTSQTAYLLFTSAVFIAPIKIIFNTIVVYSAWKIFHLPLQKQAFIE